MKKLLLLLLLPFISIAQHPDSIQYNDTYVVDNAHLYTPEEKEELSQTIRSFFDTVEIVLVTVNSLQGYDVQEYATRVFNHWGVGSKSNNGLLVLIAPTDNKAFAATGNAIQGELTDAKAASLQREVMTPEFGKGNYYTGTKNILNAYIKVLSPSAQAYHSKQWFNEDYFWLWFTLVISIIIISSGVVVYILNKRGKNLNVSQQKSTPETEDNFSQDTHSADTSSNGIYMSDPITSYNAFEASNSSDSSNNNPPANDFGGGYSDGGGGGSSW